MWWKYVLLAIIGYAIGNISSGVLISKFGSGMDVRKEGSGNIGATNMLRTQGWLPGLITLLCDTFKGIIATLIGIWVIGRTGGIVCGLGAIIGHNWPVVLKFKGGKGICTSWGVCMILQPWAGPVLLAIVGVAFALTRTISIGSIAAVIAYSVINIFVSLIPGDIPTFVFAVIMTSLALFQHRSNIGRLLRHEENVIDVSKIQRWKQRARKK